MNELIIKDVEDSPSPFEGEAFPEAIINKEGYFVIEADGTEVENNLEDK